MPIFGPEIPLLRMSPTEMSARGTQKCMHDSQKADTSETPTDTGPDKLRCVHTRGRYRLASKWMNLENNLGEGRQTQKNTHCIVPFTSSSRNKQDETAATVGATGCVSGGTITQKKGKGVITPTSEGRRPRQKDSGSRAPAGLYFLA